MMTVMSDGKDWNLSSIRVLVGLPENDMRELESNCVWKRFIAGDAIVDKDTPTDDVYFLVFGHARVVHRIDGGDEINIAQLDAGETIGAISAIDGGRRSATVIANVDCGTATIESAEFRDLLAEHGLIALNYLKRFSKIIRALDNRLTDLSMLSPDQRVYHELLRLAHPDEGTSQDWIISQLPSHREIASWANTSREAVAYVIGHLARRGIIERKHKTLYIHDYHALQAMVH